LPYIQHSDRFTRAIHPLDLDKEETPRIVEHADRWKNKLERLKTIPDRPDPILFVARQPKGGRQLDVCQQT